MWVITEDRVFLRTERKYSIDAKKWEYWIILNLFSKINICSLPIVCCIALRLNFFSLGIQNRVIMDTRLLTGRLKAILCIMLWVFIWSSILVVWRHREILLRWHVRNAWLERSARRCVGKKAIWRNNQDCWRVYYRERLAFGISDFSTNWIIVLVKSSLFVNVWRELSSLLSILEKKENKEKSNATQSN